MHSYPLFVIIAFVPIILGVGIVTSFEDAATFKIRNRLVFAGIWYVLFVYAVCSFLSVWGFVPLLPIEVRESVLYLLNDAHRWVATSIISFIVGFVLWKRNIWGGGDAKLFLCYAMLTPIGIYRYVYLNGYFASFLHLQLTFIPAMLFLMVRLISFRIFRGTRVTVYTFAAYIKNWISLNFSFRSLKSLLKTTMGFLGLLLFSRVFSRHLSSWVFSLGMGQNIVLVLILLWYKGLTRFFKRSAWFTVFMYTAFVVMAIFYFEATVKEILLQLPRSIVLLLLTGFAAPWLYRLVDDYAEQTKRKYSAMAVWMFIATCIIWIW